MLRKALRQERARGRAGRRGYDLDRHLALARALAAELRNLARWSGATHRERAAGGSVTPRPRPRLGLAFGRRDSGDAWQDDSGAPC
ncbi:hypothetical protein [Methylobrevis pamukkalensis]|nr:hypothetical protein [Methylobrevis pamukkalensis]